MVLHLRLGEHIITKTVLFEEALIHDAIEVHSAHFARARRGCKMVVNLYDFFDVMKLNLHPKGNSTWFSKFGARMKKLSVVAGLGEYGIIGAMPYKDQEELQISDYQGCAGQMGCFRLCVTGRRVM